MSRGASIVCPRFRFTCMGGPCLGDIAWNQDSILMSCKVWIVPFLWQLHVLMQLYQHYTMCYIAIKAKWKWCFIKLFILSLRRGSVLMTCLRCQKGALNKQKLPLKNLHCLHWVQTSLGRCFAKEEECQLYSENQLFQKEHCSPRKPFAPTGTFPFERQTPQKFSSTQTATPHYFLMKMTRTAGRFL